MPESVNNAPPKPRRQYYNIHITQLSNYRLPVAGIVSILHRISGCLIFLLLPFVLYLLEQSLVWEKFVSFQEICSNWFVKLILLGLAWGFVQHLCSGVRHLFMDLHFGIEKESSKQSATIVMAVSLALTALIALKLFGVY